MMRKFSVSLVMLALVLVGCKENDNITNESKLISNLPKYKDSWPTGEIRDNVLLEMGINYTASSSTNVVELMNFLSDKNVLENNGISNSDSVVLSNELDVLLNVGKNRGILQVSAINDSIVQGLSVNSQAKSYWNDLLVIINELGLSEDNYQNLGAAADSINIMYMEVEGSFQAGSHEIQIIDKVTGVAIHSLNYWQEVLKDESHPHHEDIMSIVNSINGKSMGPFWDAVVLTVAADITGALVGAAGGVTAPLAGIMAGVSSGLVVSCIIFCD